MRCCAYCFGDRALRNDIIPIHSDSTGSCSYCQSDNVALVEPARLGDVFGLLVNSYETDLNGKSLVQWLKEDWNLFDDSSLDRAGCEKLLRDILNDDGVTQEKFSPQNIGSDAKLNSWESLRTELMHENRFFPVTQIDRGSLENLFSYLLLYEDEIEEFGTWYRARIQISKDSKFEICEMGAPPNRVASQGRANPAGIPYLYLASTSDTAIAEIRPHTGDFATVACFTTKPNLKVVDLRNPRKTVSPFLLDDDEIPKLRQDIGFLVELGMELTRPIVPNAAAIDYIPSQYICELIKKCGYHGVMYDSSVGKGVNLSLFNPRDATATDSKSYYVAKVSVEIDRN